MSDCTAISDIDRAASNIYAEVSSFPKDSSHSEYILAGPGKYQNYNYQLVGAPQTEI